MDNIIQSRLDYLCGCTQLSMDKTFDLLNDLEDIIEIAFKCGTGTIKPVYLLTAEDLV